jgi:hypothetical protein
LQPFVSAAFLAIPLAVNLLAVAGWRGGHRLAACVPLPFLAGAYGIDVYGLTQGGNLAGLFTILAAPPALVWLLLVFVFRLLAALRARRAPDAPRDGAAMGEPGPTPGGWAAVTVREWQGQATLLVDRQRPEDAERGPGA